MPGNVAAAALFPVRVAVAASKRVCDGQPVYTIPVPFATFQPLPLTRKPEPFSHPDWLFEVKYDGFRALAHRDPSGVRLISRNGNRFASFGDFCASIECS